MSAVQTGDLKTGFTPGNAWGLGVCVVREPRGVSAALSPGSFGHGGAYGTQAWIDPVKKVAYVLMVQRANFPNADASDVQKSLPGRRGGTRRAVNPTPSTARARLRLAGVGPAGKLPGYVTRQHTGNGAWLEWEGGGPVTVGQSCSIGRAVGNQVVLASEDVSRRHAVINEEGPDEFHILDLGSSNGTFVNGRRVTRSTALADGDAVQVGPFRIVFRQRSTPTSQAASDRMLRMDPLQTVRQIKGAEYWLVLADLASFRRRAGGSSPRSCLPSSTGGSTVAATCSSGTAVRSTTASATGSSPTGPARPPPSRSQPAWPS